MKVLIFITLVLFISSHSALCQSGEVNEWKTFTSQFALARNNLFILDTGGIVKGYRTREIIASNMAEHSVYFETSISFMSITDGGIQIVPDDTNAWFIPVDIGGIPVKLTSGKCIRLICARYGQMMDFCPECVIEKLPRQLTVIGGVIGECSRAYAIAVALADCESEFPHEYYTGGVIVNADSVQISDPEWYKPNNYGTLIFKIDEYGNIIGPLPDIKKD